VLTKTESAIGRREAIFSIDTRESFFAAPAAKDGKTRAKFDARRVTFCRECGKRSPGSGKRCRDPGKVWREARHLFPDVRQKITGVGQKMPGHGQSLTRGASPFAGCGAKDGATEWNI